MLLSPRFEEALTYATRLHAKQLRKGGEVPYAAHVLAVAALVLENGGSEDEAIAALLHDAVEDQGGAQTREEIRRRFGDTVTAIVDGCTDADGSPKPPWQRRKEAYLRQLPAASPSVRLVAAADKLHNARTILDDLRLMGNAVWRRFNGGKEGTLWYYRAVLEALQAGGNSRLIDELERVVIEMEKLAKEKQ